MPDRKNVFILCLIALLGVILSASVSAYIYVSERNSLNERFTSAAIEQRYLLEAELEKNTNLLRNLVAFYDSSEKVEAEEFKVYASSLMRDYQGIRALEWIPHVPLEDRDTFEAEVRRNAPNYYIKEIGEDGKMKPAGVRARYFPVCYIEPMDNNEQALGYDLYSNLQRRTALNQAWETKSIVATEPLELVQEESEGWAELVFAPVFESIAGEDILIGFVLSVFNIQDVVGAALQHYQNEAIDIRLVDNTDPNSPIELYSTVRAGALVSENAKFKYEEAFSIGGRSWMLQAFPAEGAPRANYIFARTNLAFIVGLLLTAYFVHYQWLMLRRNTEIEQRVAERTVALQESDERYSLSVKGSSVGLWDWNVKNGQLYWSPRMREILGMRRQEGELQFSDFESRLHPEDRDRVIEAVRRHLSDRMPFDTEYRLKRAEGDYVWVHARGQAIWNKDGKPTRMAGSIDDVSDRKQAIEQLELSHQELRDLSLRVQSIQEEERRRIAREIHDQLGQLLTSFKIDISWLKSHLEDSVEKRIEVIERLYGDCDDMIQCVRKIAQELRPALLDDFGLSTTIEWHAEEFEKRTGVRCVFESSFDERTLDIQRATAIFRICQEALTNVARHAEAKTVHISLFRTRDGVELKIEDDGKGAEINKNAKPKSLGIIGMRERARAYNGDVTLISQRGIGTAVTIFFPIETKSTSN